jgi:ribose transport system ATP-binding protein
MASWAAARSSWRAPLFGKGQLDNGTIASTASRCASVPTAAARRAGIAFVPESRGMMLFRTEQVYKNVSIAMLDRIHRCC